MSLLNRVVGKLRRLRSRSPNDFLHAVVRKTPLQLERLGTDYGGWYVPIAMLKPGAVAICAGAGEDISFDVELNRRGLNVFTADPTPRAREHVKRVLAAAATGANVGINSSTTEFYDLTSFDPARLHLMEVGLWKADEVQRFFKPRDAGHVSHSIANLQHTEDGFDARCVTLRSLCATAQVDTPLLAKIDIEGAEYAVLDDIAANGPHPQIVSVEFDEGYNPLDADFAVRIERTVRNLLRVHYRLAHVDGWNCLFVRARS